MWGESRINVASEPAAAFNEAGTQGAHTLQWHHDSVHVNQTAKPDLVAKHFSLRHELRQKAVHLAEFGNKHVQQKVVAKVEEQGLLV